MLIVFVLQDFGDGGAFPEIHVAQYPHMYFFALESTISSVLANHLHYEILFEESYYKDILTELVAFCCTRQWIGWFVFKVWLDHFVTLALQCLSPTMNINEN